MNIKPRLVICSGADVPLSSPLRHERRVVELDTLNSDPNTHLRIDNVTDAFARNLPKRLVDLLEIATYVYTADCEASRELAWVDDKSTEPWPRNFHFVMPVRDINFWKQPDVCSSLVRALDFLSSDHFEFEFRPLLQDRKIESYLEIGDEDMSPFKSIDRVTMFSGGLDSLAGTVETASRGEPQVLVSHRPAAQMNKRQKALFDKLRETFAVQMMHIPVWVNKTDLGRESTQRTRSFLFSALGAAVASVLGAGGVRFYENGVVSLNWPLADETLQSRASRTTHPEALKHLQSFYRLVVGKDDFVIDNPYIFKTKTEVVRVIADNEAKELITQSCSCAHTMFQTKNQWHCGRCGQCIDRRIAVMAAGMQEFDSQDDYVSDVFTGPRPVNPDRPYDHNIAVNYARFASDLNRMTEQEIGGRYNLELARAVRCFPKAAEAAQCFIDMHKRHVDTVCTVLGTEVERHAREFVDGSLEGKSLLAMVGRGEHLKTASDTATRDIDKIAKHETIQGDNVFRFWDNYRQVEYRGEVLSLSQMQAAAVKLLHEAYQNGKPTLSAASLLSAMAELGPTRLSDIFRRTDKRHVLIKRIGRDSYKLNL